jgi:hypothetical protein
VEKADHPKQAGDADSLKGVFDVLYGAYLLAGRDSSECIELRHLAAAMEAHEAGTGVDTASSPAVSENSGDIPSDSKCFSQDAQRVLDQAGGVGAITVETLRLALRSR